MKKAMIAFILMTAQMSYGVQQFWVEEKPDGTKMACAAYSFWDSIQGKKNCQAYKEDKDRPDAGKLLTLGSPVVSAADRKQYEISSEGVKFLQNEVEETKAEVKKLVVEAEKLKTPEATKCKGTLEEQEKCAQKIQDKVNGNRKALNQTTEQVNQLQGYLDDAKKDLNETLKVVTDIEKKAQFGNEILKVSNMLMDVRKFENLIGDAQENLNIIERSLDNSLVEAYMLAKMKKLAGNLCEAQKQCPTDSSAAGKAFLNGVLDEARIMKSLEGPKSQSPKSGMK